MRNMFLLLSAALTLSAAIAEAQPNAHGPLPAPEYHDGRGRGGGHGGGRGPGWGRPDRGPGRGRPGPGYGGPGYPPPPPHHPGPGRPGPGYPGNPGYGTITIEVPAGRMMFNNDRLDVAQFVNFYQYRGYRVVSIDFVAHSQYQNALLDIFVNGYQMAPTMHLNAYPNNFRILPHQNLYIGHGGENISFYSRGPLHIRNIYLQLSR